jgi:hypothetical protein
MSQPNYLGFGHIDACVGETGVGLRCPAEGLRVVQAVRERRLLAVKANMCPHDRHDDLGRS